MLRNKTHNKITIKRKLIKNKGIKQFKLLLLSVKGKKRRRIFIDFKKFIYLIREISVVYIHTCIYIYIYMYSIYIRIYIYV